MLPLTASAQIVKLVRRRPPSRGAPTPKSPDTKIHRVRRVSLTRFRTYRSDIACEPQVSGAIVCSLQVERTQAASIRDQGIPATGLTPPHLETYEVTMNA